MRTYHVDRDGDLIDSETDLLADIGDNDVVPASVAQALYDALMQTRSIVCDGCEEGFNPLAGDWAERLFYNNASITKALSLADGEE